MGLNRYYLQIKQIVFIELIKRKKNAWNFATHVMFVLTMLTFVILCITKYAEYQNESSSETRPFIYVEPADSFFRFAHSSLNERKDWHDYRTINEEKERKGNGEQGKPHYADTSEEKLNKKMFEENGYYGLVSDKISVIRAVPDVRHHNCKNKTYLKELPTVSVVIPVYNEHLSTLLRTVYSIIHRSPPELLKEIILVNDQSTTKNFYDSLETYIKLKLSHFVKLIALPKRSGLISARLAGAKVAIGDVLVFLDAHTEANVNWLPPLLEPISKNYRVCTCPLVDMISYKTFQYLSQGDGSRGVFDWNFHYQRIPVKPEYQKEKSDPFPNPVMVGGLFAISAKFFWELGGYDPGLDIWGGEQYELSFKIWLCGGELYNIPCSRVGHVFRGGMPFPNDRIGIDFLGTNLKRVAEVWMDEYKEFIYKRNPKHYARIITGDLSYQFFIKKRQQCKPFKYFIEKVAPDMLDRFPLDEKPEFASGIIQSMAEKSLCIDTMGRATKQPVGLYQCAGNKTHPQNTQFFQLRYSRDIATGRSSKCLDIRKRGRKFLPIQTYPCHNAEGNQYFRYDLKTNQIYNGRLRKHKCVDMNPVNKTVFVTKCNKVSKTQKWQWGFVNETNIKNWLTYGTVIADKTEIRDLKSQFKLDKIKKSSQ